MKFTRYKEIGLLSFSSFFGEELVHFSSTIRGGVSAGNYSSLNLGLYSGDNPEFINENQERLAEMLGITIENLYIPYQTHKDKIVIIDEPFLSKSDLEKAQLLNGADALVTDQKNICIGVTTADCVPILIYDPVLNVFAAIHAGWKGTVLHIAGKTVRKMSETFGCEPQNLQVGIGPCISRKYFEVGEEVVETFIQAGYPVNVIGERNKYSGKMHLDLELANELSLTASGVLPSHIESANLCTYSDSDNFFSARRQTINSGRMLTGGFLK